MSRSLLYGFATGGIVVTIMAIVYSQSRPFFLSPFFQWSLIIPYFIGMILVLLKKPTPFQGAAIRSALVVFLIANFCFYAYTYLLYEVIDPNLYQLQSDLMIENAKSYGIGQPGESDQAPEILYAPEKFKYSLKTIPLWYAQGAIFGAAVSFLLGTLLGKKETQ